MQISLNLFAFLWKESDPYLEMSACAASEDLPPREKAVGGQQTDLQPLYDKPWRVVQDVTLEELKKTLANYAPVKLTEDPVSATNVLLVGPVGSGKSSFFNTVNSAFEGRIIFRACAGSTGTGQSITLKSQGYVVRDPASRLPMKFRLYDARGLDDSKVLRFYSFMESFADTKLTFGTLLPPDLAHDLGFENVHCIVIVLDSGTLDTTTETVWQKIKSILSNSRNLDVPLAVLLTKVDLLDPRVKEDVSLVFRSPAVEDAVSRAARLVGVPRAHVLPVKNYKSEGSLVPELDKLALLSLRSMLRLADDYLQNLPHENPKPLEEPAENLALQRQLPPCNKRITEPESPQDQAFLKWAVIGFIIVMVGMIAAYKYVDLL